MADLESNRGLAEAMLLAQRRKQAIRAVKRRIGKVEREVGDREPRSWYSFQAATRVLQRAGALTRDAAPALTPLGEAVSSVRAVNELWQGVVLSSRELDALEPAALAGVCAALLAPECVNRPSAFSAAAASPDATAALKRLAPLADQLLEIQEDEGFEAPLLVNPGMVGLLEAWANGAAWCAALRAALLACAVCPGRGGARSLTGAAPARSLPPPPAGRTCARPPTWTRGTSRGSSAGSRTISPRRAPRRLPPCCTAAPIASHPGGPCGCSARAMRHAVANPAMP